MSFEIGALTRIQHRCFRMNIAKFLKAPFFDRTPPMAASEVSCYYLLLTKTKTTSLMKQNKYFSDNECHVKY